MPDVLYRTTLTDGVELVMEHYDRCLIRIGYYIENLIFAYHNPYGPTILRKERSGNAFTGERRITNEDVKALREHLEYNIQRRRFDELYHLCWGTEGYFVLNARISLHDLYRLTRERVPDTFNLLLALLRDPRYRDVRFILLHTAKAMLKLDDKTVMSLKAASELV